MFISSDKNLRQKIKNDRAFTASMLENIQLGESDR
jgi:hypothetical protein